MFPIRRALVSAALLCASFVHAETLKFAERNAKFAPVFQFQTVQHAFEVSNTGDKPVRLISAEPRSGRGTISGVPATIAAGATYSIAVDVPLGAALGATSSRFALFTDEPDVERYRFSLSGFVQNAFEPEVPLLEFGDVVRGNAVERQFELSTREASDWKLVDVADAPDFVKVSLSAHTVKAILLPTAPPGFVIGELVLTTSLASQPKVTLGLRGYVTGELQASARALSLGTVEIGSTASAKLAIRSSTSADHPLKLTMSAPEPWHLTTLPCEPVSNECAVVEISGQPKGVGPFTGELTVKKTGSAEPALPIRFVGIALKPGQVVRDVLASNNDAPETESIDKAIAKAMQPKTETDQTAATPATGTRSAEGAGPVRLHWSAKDESKTFGYLVYRATDRAGPFVRVSKAIIQVSKLSATENRYEFVDSDIQVGKTYFYYVDSIDSTGIRKRLSPVMQKAVTAE
ncbi:MAG: hypothetical protein WBP11_09055 [Dokdonella sp.]